MKTILKFIIIFCSLNLLNLLVAFFGYIYFRFDVLNSFIALIALEMVILFYQKEMEDDSKNGK